MTHRRLSTQILLPFLGLVIASVVLATWDSVNVRRQFHLQEMAEVLETHAQLAARELESPFNEANSQRTDGVCKELGTLTGARITIILPSGKVVADSNEDPSTLDNHGDRSEVAEALAGRVGQAQRYSYTLRSDWLYVAAPVFESGKVVGVVRASKSLASLDAALRKGMWRSAIGGGVVVALSVLMAILLARRITRPLRQMKRGVRRFAHSDFSARVVAPHSAELAELAEAMNTMAGELSVRIEGMERQRSELNAVLSSMTEGILAVDTAERIVRMNDAAAGLFGITPADARGKTIQEVARNPRLQEFVRRILSEGQSFEEELVLGGAQEKSIRVTATPLRGEEEARLGALLALDDVTRVRGLERMRSEFVANVSHEVRTPITSIKGYAETLLNDRPDNTETVERFLEIIVRQSDRLCNLVDDILALANLERSEVSGEVDAEDVGLCGVLDSAVHVCSGKASARGVDVGVKCDAGLTVRGDRSLLEQAIINLLDNAIKYSDSGATVAIEAARIEGNICVRVRDSGIGISSEHLPRIFERFYRVDRARSRAGGGTGLGLSIVKHIIAVHQGHVTVESAPGKGSCFTLYLPPA